VLYVQSLIGPDTVNTLPLETIDSFRDHGRARASLEKDADGAAETLRELAAAGISLGSVTADLLEQGLRKFAEPFDKLLGSIEARRRPSAESLVAETSARAAVPGP
jgi:transaldolase/glucose-6-phosphate isomerase